MSPNTGARTVAIEASMKGVSDEKGAAVPRTVRRAPVYITLTVGRPARANAAVAGAATGVASHGCAT
jgi:hypothetical protein